MITFLKRILGFGPFKQVDPGNSYSDGRFYAIRAINDDCTLDATTSEGDDLTGLVLQQGAAVQGTFESISVDGGSAGSALVYTL